MSVLHRSCFPQPGLAGGRKLALFQSQPANLLVQPKLKSTIKRQHNVQMSASSERGGGFTTGFILGGVIFGSLGFLFAPQISRALLTEDQKLKLPRFLEDEVRDPEQTKQELSDKIAQLNAAIDEVSNQMKAKDPKPVEEVVA